MGEGVLGLVSGVLILAQLVGNGGLFTEVGGHDRPEHLSQPVQHLEREKKEEGGGENGGGGRIQLSLGFVI